MDSHERRHFGALNTFNNLLWNYEIDTIVYRPGIDYGCGACLVINIVFFLFKMYFIYTMLQFHASKFLKSFHANFMSSRT